MAQDFSLNIPLVDGHGNVGSSDGSSFAAMRYCLTGDMYLKQSNGKLLRMDKVVNDSKEESTTKLNDFKIYDYKNNIQNANKFFNSGKHNILEVKTKFGNILKGSKNHPILTLSYDDISEIPKFEWKTLDNLTLDDYAIIVDKLPKIDTICSEEQKQLAIFLGGFVAEGGFSINQKYYRITFNNQDKNYYDEVFKGYKIYLENNNFSDLNIRETTPKKSNGNVFEFATENKDLYTKLSNETGIGSYNIKIPEIIMESTYDIQRWFLKALYEGDGSINIRYDKRRDSYAGGINYTTYSKTLATQLKVLLLNFGIKTTSTNDRIGYRIQIQSYKYVKRFRELIGFLSERKSSRLEELYNILEEKQNKHRFGSSEVERIPFIAEFIRNNAVKNREKLKSINLKTIDGINKNIKLLKESLLDDNFNKVIKLISKIEKYDFSFEKINSIEELEDKQIVYSIHVESKDHSFIANSFINHNTEARLSKFAEYNLEEISKNAVDFEKNYTEEEFTPISLPMKTCVLLINGSFGIAGGFSQSILPHNPEDVCNMIIKLIKDPNMDVKDVAKELVPDFPTGGILCSKKAIENAYITGSGNVRLRCRTKISTDKKGKSEIIITEIPYMTTTGPKDGKPDSGILKSITNVVKDGIITGIADITDMGNNGDIEIHIKLKKDEDPEIILNQLFKYTLMETTQNISLVAKNGNHFNTYNIKEIFEEFIEYRINCIRRSIIFDINKKQKREHILEGLIKAHEDIDKAIEIIKNSESTEIAKEALQKHFKITNFQAEAIVDMKLRALTNIEVNKLIEERKSLLEEIKVLKDSLSLDKIKEKIISEQKEIIKKWGKPRKTTVEEIDTNITTEDIIPDENTIVLISHGNYIKRIKGELKTQKRNTTRGMNIGDDGVMDIFSASTKDHLLCFTNLGRVFDIKAFEIKEVSSAKNKGSKIESYLNLKDNEVVNNILCINNIQMNDSESSFLFITKNGMTKRSKLDQFNNIRSSGLIAMLLKSGDELVSVKYIDSSKDMQDIIVSTKLGQTVRYDINEIKEMKRDTMGTKIMFLAEDDYITDACIIEDENQLIFFATKNGLGKVVRVTDMVEKIDPNTKKVVTLNDGFPRLKRSANIKGRMGIRLRDEDELVSILTIENENQNLMVVTKNQLLVVPAGEFRKPVKRPTYGMRLVKLKENDVVTKVITQ